MDPENDDTDLVDDVPEGEAPPPDADDDELPPDDGDGGDGGDGGDEEPPLEGKPPAKKSKQQQQAPQPRQQPQTVPLATFLQEKNKFSEALETERAERKKLADELEKIKNPPKAPPKFAEDPEGYIAHQNKATAQEVLAKLDEHGKKIGEVVDSTKQTAEQRAEQKFVDDLIASEQVFVQQAPDYHQALLHVRRIAYAQLKVFHPDATDEQLADAIVKQELAMAKQATAAGRNPHELAYALALANGYTKQAPATKKGGKPGGKVALPPPQDGEETLDPDLTLGRSNGEAPDPDEDDIPDPNTHDPFDVALKEMFGRQQRRRA